MTAGRPRPDVPVLSSPPEAVRLTLHGWAGADSASAEAVSVSLWLEKPCVGCGGTGMVPSEDPPGPDYWCPACWSYAAGARHGVRPTAEGLALLRFLDRWRR